MYLISLITAYLIKNFFSYETFQISYTIKITTLSSANQTKLQTEIKSVKQYLNLNKLIDSQLGYFSYDDSIYVIDITNKIFETTTTFYTTTLGLETNNISTFQYLTTEPTYFKQDKYVTFEMKNALFCEITNQTFQEALDKTAEQRSTEEQSEVSTVVNTLTKNVK